jgi:hypothetical protein
MIGFEWTKAATDHLIACWQSDKTAAECAVILAEAHGGKLTRNSVLGKVFRLGLSRKDGETRARKAQKARQARAKKAACQARKPAPLVAPVPEQIDGKRAWFSLFGIARLRPEDPNRRGVLVGWSRCGHPKVRWDGNRTAYAYHPSFIELETPIVAGEPVAQPEPEPVLQAASTDPDRPTLFSIGAMCCRFPLWPNGPAPRPQQAFVCGAPVAVVRGDPKPYCLEHSLLCWSQEEAKTRAVKAEKKRRQGAGDRVFKAVEAA